MCFAWVWIRFGYGVALVLLGLCFGLGSSLAGFLLWFCWVGVAASDQGGAGPHPCNLILFLVIVLLGLAGVLLGFGLGLAGFWVWFC